jgi:hypothetical protein
MTRKDFELIADSVAIVSDDDERHALTMDLVRRLSDTNPNFSPSLFAGRCKDWTAILSDTEITTMAAPKAVYLTNCRP